MQTILAAMQYLLLLAYHIREMKEATFWSTSTLSTPLVLVPKLVLCSADGNIIYISMCPESLRHEHGQLRTYVTMTPLTFKNTTVAVASKVAISVDGNAHQYSSILLRDLCECQACIHEFTRQKLYSVTDIPPNIQARSVTSSESTSDAIDILWDSDVPGFDPHHTTTISTDVLRDIDRLGAVKTTFHIPTSRSRLWDSASFALPDIKYESYMHDDATLYQAIEQLQTHGLLFVTDVPGVEKSVSAIAERIGPLKDTFYGNTWDGRSKPLLNL